MRLWNYLRGYVIIIVNGYFIEKFMNVCTHRQIYLWDVRRVNSDTITMKTSINGFRLLRPVAKKTKCRVRLLKKRGWPFILNRYRKRKTFIGGAILFIILMYIMSSFVWSVDISGNKKLETSYILDAVGSCGIKPGILKYTVDTEKAVSYLMLNLKELSWASISIHGTRVNVEVREGTIPPALVPKNEPCNVIASKDAVIKSVIAEEGYEAVAEGDTVQAGQLLISGKIPVKNEKDKYRLVHAMGTVNARTWYEVEKPVATENITEERTGNVINNYSLLLFAKKVNLFHSKAVYEKNDKEESIDKLAIGDLVFPFQLMKESYYEIEQVKTVLTAEDAKQKATDEALLELGAQVPANAKIVRQDIKFISDDDKGYIVRITAECIEDIGITEKIGGD